LENDGGEWSAGIRRSGRGRGGREGVEVTLGRGTGHDAAVGEEGEAADVAVADFAKECEAAFGEGGGIGDLVGVDTGGGEFLEVDPVDASGVAGGGERGVGIEQEEIENRIDGERDAGRGGAVADEVERAFGRGAREDGAVGERLHGEDLGRVEFGEVAGGVGACGDIVGDLENFSVGPGADKELGGVGGGFKAPEQVGGRGHGELREDGAGDEAAVGAGGETFQVSTGDIAKEIDVGFFRERVGVNERGEAGADETRETHQKRPKGKECGERSGPTEHTEYTESSEGSEEGRGRHEK
jgi:hypothetical protein